MLARNMACWALAWAGALTLSASFSAGCKGGEEVGGPSADGGSSSGSGSSSGVASSSSGGSGTGSGGSGTGSGGSSSGTGSGGSSGSGSSSGGSDACGSPGVTCIVPPPPPSGGAPAAASHNYAIHKLYLGDTDRTGVTSSQAWQTYGYNLDGKVTTRFSTDVCTLAAGASKTTQADGNGGIDNSFGENILPIYITVSGSDFAQNINASIQAGTSTVMTYVTGFDDSAGNTTSATGLTGVFLYGGTYPGGAPSWSTTTHWPILPMDISGCTPTAGCPAGTDPVKSASIQFPVAYQSGGTFVSGTHADIELSFGSASLVDLPIRHAVISFSPVAPGSVTNGTIAGVMLASELVAALQQQAGRISTSLCSGSAFESIAQQIDQASDMVLDPGNGGVTNTPGTPCNAISIGLGFDATEIAAPAAADITAPEPPAPNPCAD